jgi:hypothetical protein
LDQHSLQALAGVRHPGDPLPPVDLLGWFKDFNAGFDSQVHDWAADAGKVALWATRSLDPIGDLDQAVRNAQAITAGLATAGGFALWAQHTQSLNPDQLVRNAELAQTIYTTVRDDPIQAVEWVMGEDWWDPYQEFLDQGRSSAVAGRATAQLLAAATSELAAIRLSELALHRILLPRAARWNEVHAHFREDPGLWGYPEWHRTRIPLANPPPGFLPDGGVAPRRGVAAVYDLLFNRDRVSGIPDDLRNRALISTPEGPRRTAYRENRLAAAVAMATDTLGTRLSPEDITRRINLPREVDRHLVAWAVQPPPPGINPENYLREVEQLLRAEGINARHIGLDEEATRRWLRGEPTGDPRPAADQRFMTVRDLDEATRGGRPAIAVVAPPDHRRANDFDALVIDRVFTFQPQRTFWQWLTRQPPPPAQRVLAIRNPGYFRPAERYLLLEEHFLDSTQQRGIVLE